MLDRIADLTWRRPKLVLALVGAFMVLAGAVGHDVEHHLKAAGFTDSASESERATKLLRESLGYDANPGIFLVVRNRSGNRLRRHATGGSPRGRPPQPRARRNEARRPGGEPAREPAPIGRADRA